jgi:Tol biopolymer transport system component
LAAAVIAAATVLTILPARVPRVLRYTQLTHDGLKKTQYLVTDGSRIYFGEQDSQRRPVVAEVSALGGTVNTVATLPGPFACPVDYSQARTELLAFSCINQSALWALSIPGGASPRRVGNFVLDDAAWAADGQSIIYSSGNRFETVRADGSDPRTLVTLSGNPAYPRISPDGKVLRFTLLAADAVSPTFYSIWEMGADGSNPHSFFPGRRTTSEFGGSWTPDGRYFVYGSSLPNGRQSIFAIREKKTLFETHAPQPVELTAGPLSFSLATISRDGKQIFAGGYLDRGELMRYDRKLRTWIPYLSGISAADVDFSRDREWITYVLVPEGTLWRSRVDGSERVQLTISPMRASMPRWSPDGKGIAFAGLKPGGSWSLYLVPADGGEAEQLFRDNKFYEDPNWSPDGSRLVFGESAVAPKAIHILDLQSRRVTDLPGSKGLFSPRWSPDGNFILALTATIPLLPQPRSQPLPTKLMAFDLHQQKWQELCESRLIAYPTFSRNGKYIYFSDSSSLFYRIDRGTGKIETVANIDVPGGIKMGDFWLWTGLAPDDSPLLVRDASTEEIYALDVDFP